MSQSNKSVEALCAQGLEHRQPSGSSDFAFHIDSIPFDENYHPSGTTRLTTNFANLARGASRQENLRKALRMIANRFNALASWDNPKGDRYAVEIDIISVKLQIGVAGAA